MRGRVSLLLCCAVAVPATAQAPTDQASNYYWGYMPPAEYQAYLLSPDFQNGVIYDCLFTDPATDAPPLRQYIHDGSGLPEVLYCEPTGTDAMSCFDRTVLPAAEMFINPPFKTITVAADGAAQMRVNDVTMDLKVDRWVYGATIDYVGTCAKGAAWPDGMVADEYKP